MYKCTECQTQECTVKTFDPSVPPPVKCTHGYKPTWKKQHPDPNKPVIIWESPEANPNAAIRQLQDYFERVMV